MKKTMKSILALAVCAVAMGFASCSDDDDVNSADGNKEYLFAANCEISEAEDAEALEQQQAYVNAALAKAGFTGESDYPLAISGKDSAAVSKVLLEKMAQVEKAIADAPFEINAALSVKGAEKSIIASEDKEVRVINLWYEKQFGTPSNWQLWIKKVYSSGNTQRFVKGFKTVWWQDSFSCDNNTSEASFTDEMNTGAGGDNIYLYMKFTHDGKTIYTWDSSCENEYITDVIAVCGGGEPQTLYINGRKYTKENAVCDLNKGCGPKSDYIWIYSCRERFKEYDGRYYFLNTGDRGEKEGDKENVYGCRCLRKYGDNFELMDYVHQPFTKDGHKFIERAVPMYDKNGNFITNQADFNRNAGGAWIKIILTYCTKEGGY